MSAASSTNVGGTAGGSSSQSQSSQSSSQTQTISSDGDPFGLNQLPPITDTQPRKKRELPQPAESSSFIDLLVRKKRQAA
jgi:hypothetical protein